MSLHEHFRQALEDCDVELAKKIWHHAFPNMPQPKSDEEALITLHIARTGAKSIAFKHRAYSHRWLCDNGYPSNLPDELRSKAERMYPRVVDAVGIACGSNSSLVKPAIPIIRGAMEDAVKECYADGVHDPLVVKPRMLEARAYTKKKLFGIVR